MPDGLRRLHPKFRTPWIGIAVFSGFAILVCLPGQANFLGNVYSFGALMSFTLAHASVIRLRIKYPDFSRMYRGPGNVTVRGYDLPLFAIAGGTFTAVAFLVIVALHPAVAAVCVGWLAVGTLVYIAFRRRHGLDLTSTHKVAIPQPVVDHEAEYHSVLVPLSDGYDEHVVATASKLAARRRRGIHVLALVTVPNALPIEAHMAEEEAAAQSLIEQAKVQGGRRVSGHVERIRPGQAGRRIVEEASDMHAAAIVMPLPRRVDGASLFGKTLETVLAERPCRVVIESQPDSGERRKRAVALQESLA
jgi:APA family basic amino acid/polyamine antiporter